MEGVVPATLSIGPAGLACPTDARQNSPGFDWWHSSRYSQGLRKGNFMALEAHCGRRDMYLPMTQEHLVAFWWSSRHKRAGQNSVGAYAR